MDTVIPTMQEITFGMRSAETKDDCIDIIMKAVYGPVMGKQGYTAQPVHLRFPNYS
jgi:hypothetical protein